jgi:transcriptional regulator with XRE-family HTH domain
LPVAARKNRHLELRRLYYRNEHFPPVREKTLVNSLEPVTFDDLVRMANRVRIPTPETDVSSIVAGQVWHLQWDAASELGVVTVADDQMPTFVPLMFGATPEGEALNLPELHTEAIPLWQYARQIPAVALVGVVASAEVPAVAEAQDLDEGDDSIEHAMTELSEWITAGDGTGELTSLLQATGMPVSELSAVLHVSKSEVLDLRRGARVPDAQLGARLAGLLNISADDVQASNNVVPSGLKAALSRRRYRTRVKTFAERNRVSDSKAWFDSAYGTMAMSYRSTGSGADDQWESRADRFFGVTL